MDRELGVAEIAHRELAPNVVENIAERSFFFLQPPLQGAVAHPEFPSDVGLARFAAPEHVDDERADTVADGRARAERCREGLGMPLEVGMETRVALRHRSLEDVARERKAGLWSGEQDPAAEERLVRRRVGRSPVLKPHLSHERGGGIEIEFLGRFYAPNLTSDPVHGIGAVADEDLARMVRYGVKRSGRRGVMPTYGMGDADIAAVLGYLRSDDPLFAPDGSASPPSTVSTIGKVVFVASGMSALPDRPASGVPVPEKTDAIAYGRYLAHDVLDCVGCHTPGYHPSKGTGRDRFAGGFEFERPDGRTVVSPNLTPDGPTGLAHYSRDDLARALRRGQRPDGSVLSSPMPIFRALDDLDINALYTYMRSLPPRQNDAARRPGDAAPVARTTPEARFRQLGCAGCHGKGAPYVGALVKARDESPDELAGWIRTPERFIPGTQMPTYAELLDERGALELATWVKTDGPQRLATR